MAAVQGNGRSVAENGANGEPELGAVPVIEHYSDIAFPLDKYVMTPGQRVSLNRAADLVVLACMKRFGFDYQLPNRREGQDDDRSIGVVDESEAGQFGYNNPRARRQLGEANAEKEEQKKLPRPPAMVALLRGDGPTRYNGSTVPEGGCYGEARRALGRSDVASGSPGDDNFVFGLASASSRLAEADSRLEEVFAKWSQCMSDVGFKYGSPWDANDDPAFRGETASSAETATATADVKCRKTFNVNGIWVAVRTAYQNQLIERNAHALSRHQGAVEEQARRAADIIAAPR